MSEVKGVDSLQRKLALRAQQAADANAAVLVGFTASYAIFRARGSRSHSQSRPG